MSSALSLSSALVNEKRMRPTFSGCGQCFELDDKNGMGHAGPQGSSSPSTLVVSGEARSWPTGVVTVNILSVVCSHMQFLT